MLIALRIRSGCWCTNLRSVSSSGVARRASRSVRVDVGAAWVVSCHHAIPCAGFPSSRDAASTGCPSPTDT